MSEWIHFGEDWFNINDFCHIWIETISIREVQDEIPTIKTVYYAMGEYRHNSEEVIVTENWCSKDQLCNFLNENLGS